MEVCTLRKPFTFHICLKLAVTTFALVSFLQLTSAKSSPQIPKAYVNFVKTTCKTTTYPLLCYKSLTPYTSSIKKNYITMCYAALAATIKAARNTSAMVSRLAKQKGLSKFEDAAITDCIENIEDSVDKLQQTLRVMTNLRGADRKFQLSNAKTWASAAITDDVTCLDGFSGRKISPQVKKKIKSSITNVTRLNSNALYLINQIK